MTKIQLSILFLLISSYLYAHEGMWVPTLLDKYNIEEMQQMGFKLTTEDIYSINQNSMKDAVVLFGSGCTGEMVSSEGLLFTNHHCGYSYIQSHSTLENDYLTNGFWAMSKDEELSNPGLKVRFLEYMADVTDSVMAGTDGLEESALSEKIADNIQAIENEASDSTKYEAIVKPLFYGNQYFVYVYKVYTDVRLVGAPPSAIGKFGGDTDNWMWPRHTGDFSVFRVYADENNEPADYSPYNVPYQSKSFLPISLKGVEQNDFVMIYGFPGSTEQYLPSEAVELVMNQSDPDRVKIRTEKLNILSKHMEAEPKVRIQYASKYARASNSWKRWQGEIKGLQRMDALAIKESFENEFQNWYGKNDSLKTIYSELLSNFEEQYSELRDYNRAYNYYSEIVSQGTDVLSLVRSFSQIGKSWSSKDEEDRQQYIEKLQEEIQDHFKNYNLETDQEVFIRLINQLKADLDPIYLPEKFHELLESNTDEGLRKKVYQKSKFTNQEKLLALVGNLNDAKIRKLEKDPIMLMYLDLIDYYRSNIASKYNAIQSEIETLQKTYMAGIMEMKQGQTLYPDANLTLRVAYGKVEGYQPLDGVNYKHYTTLKGIVEKDNQDVYDYKVPQRLKDLYQSKDFGDYGKDGEMPVAFTASVHTTGGNSGSPAINANGELIGLNFDRCWEGTMSDIIFDPDQCRNIMVDVRYVLFLIDKFAGAGYLLDEMQIR